ncbi:hypothetical protein EMIHUDRAFT_253768 [Emiliania huxleyi CCMP1516]|uniref:Uncharacterized protein n=2 Tax=Emiliania huxleyi TaxID=2903 RepID=A0A0D3K3B2_EMIH1|nr:hypothetical protein EMIHUDRAFT_253768 [Emiliania huxleyi CCMP1516]EOD30247.1 hypothetical protein EMIHUDRAFT_253768 [Emiliania huxleyi CCMP1516]|eukprot:XP_005782676.1 hypothetical protein EMIHUDRAFT_253768 [Emiliania huxleyi CCMP1516]
MRLYCAVLGWWVWDHSQDTLEGWDVERHRWQCHPGVVGQSPVMRESPSGAVSPACGGLPPEVPLRRGKIRWRKIARTDIAELRDDGRGRYGLRPTV